MHSGDFHVDVLAVSYKGYHLDFCVGYGVGTRGISVPVWRSVRLKGVEVVISLGDLMNMVLNLCQIR